MAANKKLTPLEQRDRRAKMMLAGLGVLLLAVLGFELPGLLGGKSGAPAAATTATTPSSTATAVAVPAASSSLAGATIAVDQTGRLVSFSRFAAKDPFHALVAVSATTTTGSGSTVKQATGRGVSAKPKTPAKPVTFSVHRAKAVPTGPLVPAVVLQLNGTRRVIPVGSGFPESHPVFKLVSVGSRSIWISLVGGSFGGGKQTLRIDAGHPVKLVNTTAATKYLIKVVRVTTAPKPKLPTATGQQTVAANDTARVTTTTAGP